jgi:hypothetical protein
VPGGQMFIVVAGPLRATWPRHHTECKKLRTRLCHARVTDSKRVWTSRPDGSRGSRVHEQFGQLAGAAEKRRVRRVDRQLLDPESVGYRIWQPARQGAVPQAQDEAAGRRRSARRGHRRAAALRRRPRAGWPAMSGQVDGDCFMAELSSSRVRLQHREAPKPPCTKMNRMPVRSGEFVKTLNRLPCSRHLNALSCRVASRQDAREGGFVASCDCARLGTRARVAGWDLLVVIL